MKKTKKRNFFKRFLTCCLSVLVGIGGMAMFGCNGQEAVAVESVLCSLSNVIGDVDATTGYVSKTVTATIEPANATDKYVTYSVEWAEGAEKSNENINDYITVTQAVNGALKATVTCKKSFYGSSAILKCETRDGNFTSTIPVTYKGFIHEMTISSSSMSMSSDTDRGNYYKLETAQNYTFDINVNNAFGDVRTHDLSYSVKTSKGFWIANRMINVENSGEFMYTNEANFSEIDPVERGLVQVFLNGSSLTIQLATTSEKTLRDYNYTGTTPWTSGVNHDAYKVTLGDVTKYGTAYNNIVMFDAASSNLGVASAYVNGHNQRVNQNINNYNTCVYELTVTDSISGISATIPFWIIQEGTALSLSATEITF